jgi:deazaflavin-dependent oxidoreductase (nitroreductase family)
MTEGKARHPPRWFIEIGWYVHRRIVRASRGRRGLWPPRPDKCGALRLTTIGRRSGEPRSVIIAYYEDGPNLVAMAMNGWGAAEPAWWLNLQADPHAVVELAGGIRREVLGRPAVGGEREQLWQRWCELATWRRKRGGALHLGCVIAVCGNCATALRNGEFW